MPSNGSKRKVGKDGKSTAIKTNSVSNSSSRVNKVDEAKAEPTSGDQDTILMSSVFSKVVALMSMSQFHRYSFISDLEWLVAPALLHGQYKVWEKAGVPIAFVSWANISNDVENRFAEGGIKLKPDEWNCGASPWIVDVICPGGDPKPFLQEVVREHFAQSGIKTIAPDDEGNRRVVLLKVSNITQQVSTK